MKKIKLTLDPNSIESAISQLEAYKKEFNEKAKLFIERLTEKGVEIAKIEIATLGAIDTGELEISMQNELMFTDGSNKGIIFTKCPHAAFVEFGTGVVGAGASHPSLPWAYDIHGHGEAGWVYFDERQNRFRWTKGMPSRPFMFNTVRELADIAVEVAREVFKS